VTRFLFYSPKIWTCLQKWLRWRLCRKQPRQLPWKQRLLLSHFLWVSNYQSWSKRRRTSWSSMESLKRSKHFLKVIVRVIETFTDTIHLSLHKNAEMMRLKHICVECLLRRPDCDPSLIKEHSYFRLMENEVPVQERSKHKKTQPQFFFNCSRKSSQNRIVIHQEVLLLFKYFSSG
jgi:hypothetical protein